MRPTTVQQPCPCEICSNNINYYPQQQYSIYQNETFPIIPIQNRQISKLQERRQSYPNKNIQNLYTFGKLSDNNNNINFNYNTAAYPRTYSPYSQKQKTNDDRIVPYYYNELSRVHPT